MIAKSLTEAQDGLAEIVHGVERDHTPVVLTEDGRPIAAVVSMADYLWMEEAEDRWLSARADEAYEEHLRNPSRAKPAEEVFARLLADDREE